MTLKRGISRFTSRNQLQAGESSPGYLSPVEGDKVKRSRSLYQCFPTTPVRIQQVDRLSKPWQLIKFPLVKLMRVKQMMVIWAKKHYIVTIISPASHRWSNMDNFYTPFESTNSTLLIRFNFFYQESLSISITRRSLTFSSFTRARLRAILPIIVTLPFRQYKRLVTEGTDTSNFLTRFIDKLQCSSFPSTLERAKIASSMFKPSLINLKLFTTDQTNSLNFFNPFHHFNFNTGGH